MNLGRIGIWRSLRTIDSPAEIARELEELGFAALWIGSSPSVPQVRPFLQATSALTVATGILNVWLHEPADVAAQRAELAREFPGRFLLGIGIGHSERQSDYARPLSTIRAWFDAFDAADAPVPREERIAAALRPKMLALAAERSLGAHTYFVTPEHTRSARATIGPDAVLAVEQAVVLDADPASARAKARTHTDVYLGLSNYTGNLLELGFTERDIADGGSDRLVDAIVPHGTAEQVAEVVRAHVDAGADHVCVQVIAPGRGDYRALAAALI